MLLVDGEGGFCIQSFNNRRCHRTRYRRLSLGRCLLPHAERPQLRRPFTAIDHPRVFSARSASVSHRSAISMKRDLCSDVRAASANRMQSAALLRNRAKMSKCASMSLDMGTVRTLCPKNAGKIIMLPEVGGLRRPRDLFSARHCGSGSARHVTRYTQACGLPCKLPKKLSCPKNGDEPKSPLPSYWQHQCDTEPRALRSTASKQQGHIMPKDMHEKAAEHHEQTAKAHRTAAQQHGSNDHVSAKQQSSQAADKSKAAHEHSTQANNKSQQQK